MTSISGYLDERFRSVGEAFLEGFEAGQDVGASLAVFVDGTPVIDVWNGYADRRRTIPWREDTLVCMFSVTKAMTALCLLQAAERGEIDLDAPVATYWPEFAANEKGTITTRQVLSHRAGMVGFHDPVDRDIVYDWGRFTEALAREKPWWEPGELHGYHARTFGFLLGEILRRVTGRSVGEWFAAEVAAPHGLDFAIGLASEDLQRCAELLPARMRAGAEQNLPPGAQEMMSRFNDLSTPTGAAFQNPSMGAGYMNTAKFRQAEIPAANGHGTARSAAAMYDALASLLTAERLAEATTTHSVGPDEVLRSTTHFGLGFLLYHDETPIGVRSGTFGHAGAGGSMAFRDPDANLSFCFAMNQMEMGVISGGTSATRCAKAVYDCL